VATQFLVDEVASYWLRQVATKPILSIRHKNQRFFMLSVADYTLLKVGVFTLLHIKTPKSVVPALADLSCTYK
jgi:hypothetical protein